MFAHGSISSIGVRLAGLPVGSVRVREIGVETGAVACAPGVEAATLDFSFGATMMDEIVAEATGAAVLGACAGAGRFADTTATAITPITPTSSPSFASLGMVSTLGWFLSFHYSSKSAWLRLTLPPFAENSRRAAQPRRRTLPRGNRRSS